MTRKIVVFAAWTVVFLGTCLLVVFVPSLVSSKDNTALAAPLPDVTVVPGRNNPVIIEPAPVINIENIEEVNIDTVNIGTGEEKKSDSFFHIILNAIKAWSFIVRVTTFVVIVGLILFLLFREQLWFAVCNKMKGFLTKNWE